MCDKCGRDDLPPMRPERFEVVVNLPTKSVSVDLCEKCASRLDRWISERDAQDPAPMRPSSATAISDRSEKVT